MFSHERLVGRLLELRFASPITAEELDAFERQQRIFVNSGSDRIACTDCRGVEVMSPESAARLVAAFRDNAARLLRNGFLVGTTKAVVSMQIERVIREAKNPARRLFRDRDALLSWLDEILDEPERRRLRDFLGR